MKLELQAAVETNAQRLQIGFTLCVPYQHRLSTNPTY